MRKLVGNIIKADKIFNMVEDGDRICIGISGGKDSMALLFAMNLYKNILAKENIFIEVIGVHLKMNLCALDYTEITEFWKKKNIEFYIEDTHMGEILKKNMKNNRLQCSLCSKMKKAILIDAARKYNCNKIAMGHHADDAIETMFLNLINEGRISTFKPKMYLDRSEIWFIRPFITCREKDIIKEVKQTDLPILPCSCPMEGFTQRDKVKDFLQKEFYNDKKWKTAYKSFYISLFNGKEADLWFIDDDRKIIDEDIRQNGMKGKK